MFQTDQATAAAVLPTPAAAGVQGYFTNGNPGSGVPATIVDADYMNMIMMELMNVVTAGGQTASKTAYNQVLLAIQQLIINNGAAKMPVRAATTANIASLAGGAPSTLDGVTLAANDRILVKDQSTGSQNGIYVVTTLGTGANGTWTRATDADGVGEIFAGMLVVVAEGTVNADTEWEQSANAPITIGTTALTFLRFVSTLDFGSSLAASGYQKLPSGLIIQWGGDIGSSSGAKTVTFPVAFSTACYSVLTTSASAGVATSAAQESIPTTTSFSYSNWSIGSSPTRTTNQIYWLAAGR